MRNRPTPLVLLIDAGGTRVGEFPAERLERYVGKPFVQILRDRKGRMRRMVWQPMIEPIPFRLLKVGNYAGQRYVQKERLNDGPLAYDLKRITGISQLMFMQVPKSVGAGIEVSV